MGRSGRKIRLAERYRRNYFIVSVLECNNFLPVRGCWSVSRHRERCRAVAKTRRGKRTRVWLCVARLRYGRIMRGDRTGQGYCQPDGRHSADPRVPFALPATSKPSSLYAGLYLPPGISPTRAFHRNSGLSICEDISTDPSISHFFHYWILNQSGLR